MKPSEHLQKARDLITPPGAWTQGEIARDDHGELVGSTDVSAVCWCSIGALYKCLYRRRRFSEAYLRQAIGGDIIPEWNDTPGRTHAEVLDAFDRAIALAQSELR